MGHHARKFYGVLHCLCASLRSGFASISAQHMSQLMGYRFIEKILDSHVPGVH